MNLSKLRKEICIGRLIWVQPPSIGSAVFFTKKLLNSLGIQDQEMIYLHACQFIAYFRYGFTLEFLISKRVLLIGDFESLDAKSRKEFLVHLSRYKTFKHRYGVNLVLVSPVISAAQDCWGKELKPQLFPLFEGDHPIGVNEKIHEQIEAAALKYNKMIWSLTIEAATYLEKVYLSQGEKKLKRLVYRAVKNSKSKELCEKELKSARQSLMVSEMVLMTDRS